MLLDQMQSTFHFQFSIDELIPNISRSEAEDGHIGSLKPGARAVVHPPDPAGGALWGVHSERCLLRLVNLGAL